MEGYVRKDLGKTIIKGDIPCSCIAIEENNVSILIEEGLECLPACETVCPHGNYFIVVEANEKGPFVESDENILKSRIWINKH